MDISAKVIETIEFLKSHEDFNCMTIPEAKRGITVSDEAIEALKEAGMQLIWADTFKGGCWHVDVVGR